MKKIFGLLLFCNAIGFASAAEMTTPVIAVREDYADTISLGPSGTRTTYEPRLRAVFAKKADGWKAVCDPDENGLADTCPSENVRLFDKLYVFDGNYRREVTAQGLLKREWCCRDVGWLDAPNLGLAQQGTDRLLKYGGSTYDPVHKPLPLTNSNAPLKDAENWRSISAQRPLNLPASTWLSLATMVRKMNICMAPKSNGSRSVPVPWEKSHLEAVQAFANKAGQTILKAQLSPAYFRTCKRLGGDAGEIPGQWPEFWLSVVPKQPATIHVFENRIGFGSLELIEFADFDGDGKTEALFLMSGYNRGGYVLLHEKMTRQTKFVWSYH